MSMQTMTERSSHTKVAARRWSPQQQAIFAWFKGGGGNLVVRARAGTGKTTTLLEGLRYAPEDEIVCCAFNGRIAKELGDKAQSMGLRVTVKTLHSLGFAAVRDQWRGVRLDNDRGAKLAAQAAGDQAPDEMIGLVRKLATMGKACAPDAWKPESDLTELVTLAYEYDCDPDEEWEKDGWTVATIAAAAKRAMEYATRRDRDLTIDFDDMIFVAVANKFARPIYDLVVVDEAQDMCQSQLRLALRLCRPGGRIVVVGDDRQAIYQFRGAVNDGIDRLKIALKAQELPLTVTYRCGKAIVDLAKTLVPDYEAAPNAKPGQVREISDRVLLDVVKPGDAVLSRKNAPLASICMSLLRAGVRARMEGKDIGEGLCRLVKMLKAKTWESFGEKLEKWKAREVKKAESKKSETKRAESIERICDQHETIWNLAQGLTSVAALEKRLRELFSDTEETAGLPMVVCSSVHRAKGLEWDRAFVLEWTLRKDKIEEDNIAYVAYTRAKSTLYLVTKPKEK